MTTDYTVDRFHHYDGVIHHADYNPQVGDIVNVVNDIVGIDNKGNAYKLTGSTFWSDNVAQIQAIGNDTITIDDKTDHSPVVIVHAPLGAFEPANFLNAKLFKPYSTTVKVVDNVATGIESAATTTSELIKGIGSHLSWFIVAAIVIGGLLLFSNLKKAL